MSSALLAVGIGGALALAAYHSMKQKWRESKKGTTSSSAEDTFISHVCDHDGHGLVELSPGRLWTVYATFKGNGPPWRRMIIYRPPDTHKLVLLSPVAVPEDIMERLEKLGQIDVLVVPNSYHRTDIGVFKARYPGAKVACPPGWVRKKVSEVVEVNMDCRELSRRYCSDDKKGAPPLITVVRIGGVGDPGDEEEGDFELAYEFLLADDTRAYVVTDTLFNFPEGGIINWVFGCRGIARPDGDGVIPRVGRISRWFMHSRIQCADFYRGMASRDDISFIIMAHGNIVTGGVKEAFTAIAQDVAP